MNSMTDFVVPVVIVCAGCFFGVLFYNLLAGRIRKLWVVRRAMLGLQDDLAELRTHLQKTDPSVLDPHIFYKANT
jgi:hypothetical protein